MLRRLVLALTLVALSACEQDRTSAPAPLAPPQVIRADLRNVTDLVVLSGGRVVAVGIDPNADEEVPEAPALQAFDVNGQVDLSFGDAGLARPPLARMSFSRAHPAGGLVVAGTTPTGAKVIVKLRHDGRVDPSFGDYGLSTIQGPISRFAGLVVRPDGRIVVLVQTANLSSVLVGLDPSGRSDPSFGTGGEVREEIGSTFVERSALFLEPDGSLLVALSYSNPDLDVPMIVRYLPDGRRASVEGRFESGFGSTEPVEIAVARDGRIVVAFTRSIVEDGDIVAVEFYLGRFLGDGSLDPTFGQEGIVALPFRPEDLSVDRSSNVYVVGSISTERSYDVPAVIRYNGEGESGPQGMLEVTLDDEGALRAVVPALEGAEPGALFAGGVRFGEPGNPGYGFLIRVPTSPEPPG